jgi:hypothetical protein
MCRRLFVAVTTITVMLVIPASALAAGAPVRKPAATVGAAPPPSSPATTSVPPAMQGTSQEQLLGGCGRGRVRDPRTNQCRGPADISH